MQEDVKKDLLAKRITQYLAFEDIEDVHEEIDNSNILNGVYLFFSFDLVNSTSFKSNHVSDWQKAFTRFYSLIEAELKKIYPDITLWKYIGDEVLLFLKITDIKQIFDCAPSTYSIIQSVTDILYREIPNARKLLFIKSTLWIAHTNFLAPKDIETLSGKKSFPKNIVFYTGSAPEWLAKQQNIDFLGPDIDLGFRLSKYTQKSKLLISAELAYILNRKKGDLDHYLRRRHVFKENFKIISLEKLKGIWQDRRYPIMWYSESWNKDSYEYDEHLESELVQKIIEGDLTDSEAVGKIFDDLGKSDEMDEIIEIIEQTESTTPTTIVTYDIPKERLAEVHCAAICFDTTGRMLIAKRTMNKKRLKGLWEFGCGQLKVNQTIEDCIKINYKNDFNADIKFVKEKAIPITTYNVFIDEESRTVPGMLFLAIVANPDDLVNKNHDALQWLKEEELETLNEDECVGDFHSSAQKAFIQFNQLPEIDLLT